MATPPASSSQGHPSTPSAEPVLKVRGLPLKPGNPNHPLIDWEVQPGERWILGGPPGSTKTGFLELCAGLTRPEAGQIELFGDPTFRPDADHPPSTGNHQLRTSLLFGQGGRLFDELTLEENIALPLRYHYGDTLDAPVLQHHVEHWIDALELHAARHLHPARLDHGTRQRGALARALVCCPELLLLDNPTAGLPPGPAAAWVRRVESLLGPDRPPVSSPHTPPSLTLVVATSDFRPWLDLRCAHFAILDQGKLRHLGDRQTLLKSPDPCVLELLSPA